MFWIGKQIGPWFSLGTSPPKTKLIRGGNDRSFIKKTLIFWDHPFSEKYSNGPGITKNWHISKMTRIGPRICLKVLCVQIWPKKSKRKCPKWPIVNCHALCYIGGLSVNLNHLKINYLESIHSFMSKMIEICTWFCLRMLKRCTKDALYDIFSYFHYQIGFAIITKYISCKL